MPEMNARDTKLAQWLNEAHAKEAELEANLTAHIALTEKTSYKKRLQQHLKETRDHKKRVASRIKKLGGDPSTGPLPGPVGEVAGKAVAAVKGQVGVARAVISAQNETQLRNAQEELREEHVEIALYTRIETFAEAVGDKETAQLARAIRRDEERMAKFLDAELKRLVKAVVKDAVPAAERNGATRRRSTSTTRRKKTTASPSGSRSTSGRSRATGSGGGRKKTTTRRRTTASARG